MNHARLTARLFAFAPWAAAVVALLGGAAAQATPLSATETLHQFNLITLSDAVSSSHVDGRSFIGGSLTGSNAVFAMHPADMPSSTAGYAGLTVLGNVSSAQVTSGGLTVVGNVSNSTVNNGPAVVGGNSSNTNYNGNTGGSYVYGSRNGGNANSGSLGASAAATQLATANSNSFATLLGNASTNLSQLASTGSHWSISGGRVSFVAVPDGNGVAVFDLTSADDVIFGKSEFEFNLGGASTVIFNSDITSATINANFLGGSAQTIGTKTLWNFYNATNLTLNAQFGGSILATQALLTNQNNVEGGVFVNTLHQNGEIHLQAFSGSLPAMAMPASFVPETGSGALMLAGLGAVALMARRRQRAG